MGHWNFRTATHYRVVDGNRVVDEDYVTVHEVYYGDAGEPEAFCASEATVGSKEEAEMLLLAFNKPAVLMFNDDTVKYERYSETGKAFIDYGEWEWIKNTA